VYYDGFVDKWFAGTTGTAEGEGEVNNKLVTFNDLFWDTVKSKYELTEDKLDVTRVYILNLLHRIILWLNHMVNLYDFDL
jgi:hypothetical protein